MSSYIRFDSAAAVNSRVRSGSSGGSQQTLTSAAAAAAAARIPAAGTNVSQPKIRVPATMTIQVTASPSAASSVTEATAAVDEWNDDAALAELDFAAIDELEKSANNTSTTEAASSSAPSSRRPTNSWSETLFRLSENLFDDSKLEVDLHTQEQRDGPSATKRLRATDPEGDASTIPKSSVPDLNPRHALSGSGDNDCNITRIEVPGSNPPSPTNSAAAVAAADAGVALQRR